MPLVNESFMESENMIVAVDSGDFDMVGTEAIPTFYCGSLFWDARQFRLCKVLSQSNFGVMSPKCLMLRRIRISPLETGFRNLAKSERDVFDKKLQEVDAFSTRQHMLQFEPRFVSFTYSIHFKYSALVGVKNKGNGILLLALEIMPQASPISIGGQQAVVEIMMVEEVVHSVREDESSARTASVTTPSEVVEVLAAVDGCGGEQGRESVPG
ncbi:hypothetical protein AKJ16_DCAP26400 [Drosera capensis]